MITTSDFKKGLRILIDGEPYIIEDFSMQSPTARGGGTLVKTRARSLLTGRLINEGIKAGTKFEEPNIQLNSVQFLYREGDGAVFMNNETYDQFTLSFEVLGSANKYLREDLKIKALYFNGNVVNIEIPQYIECEVTMVEPGDRGNTSSGVVFTRAELDNGMEIKVPLNTKVGQRILVNSQTDEYHQRA